jgi:hypothetical protein
MQVKNIDNNVAMCYHNNHKVVTEQFCQKAKTWGKQMKVKDVLSWLL